MKNFIIIEPDPIVAMDVEGMLMSQFPQSHVTTGASLAEIGPAIHDSSPDSMFFVKGGLIVNDHDLRHALQTAVVRKTQIIVIGEPFDFAFHATFIDLPFTTDTLLAAMMQGTPEIGFEASPVV